MLGNIYLKFSTSSGVECFLLKVCNKHCLSASAADNFINMEFVEFIRTPKVDGVTLYRPNAEPVEGTLCITGHHLILSSRQNHKEEMWVS